MCPDPVDTPLTTYRLQLGPALTFADAARCARYLHDLGVSHVYLSPILEAVPGSIHGYDTVDHARIREELGGRDGFLAMRQEFRDHGLGVIVDVVPNHMAFPAPEYLNRQLWSVLADGHESAYAHWFDIDWGLHAGRLLVPILAGPLDECLADMAIGEHEGQPVLRYFDHALPLARGTELLALGDAVHAQHYQLADWRLAATDLNYRRFCDIASLIAVRVEDPGVFEVTHRALLDLIRDGHIDGLRIDHIDGLADPERYLQRLAEASDNAWVVVEKVLAAGEALPPDWECAGTTGYDALSVITEAFVDPHGAAPLTALYAEFTGEEANAETVERTAKQHVTAHMLGSEVGQLARLIGGEPDTISEAIAELVASLDVYRAYSDAGGVPALDRAAHAAKTAAPGLAGEIRAVHEAVARPGEVAARFGQLCAAAQAKGVEDTAFYRYGRLLALNEVGCDPGQFGTTLPAFHTWCERAQRERPHAMTTLSTHDTKRGEDVRARISVLAQLPGEWNDAVVRWHQAAARHNAPDPHFEYFFWQTLVGAWPLDAERATRYLSKAIHEAKRETTWHDPDTGYDADVERFVAGVFGDAALLADVGTFVARLEPHARAISLAQKLVQATMPGVPDTYQGAELTNLRLVDPDNREPVDFGHLSKLLTALADEKLRITTVALTLQRDHPDWFGEYLPLTARGGAADHVVAYARSSHCVVVAARFTGRLERAGGWRDTRIALPEGDWVDALSGVEHEPGDVPLDELVHDLPCALLVPAVAVEREYM